MRDWKSYIFSDIPFAEKAREVYHYQYENNAVYRRFCDVFDKPENSESEHENREEDFETLLQQSFRDEETDFPLLPVQAFKDTNLRSFGTGVEPELTFRSSGTSDMYRSRHDVADKELYRQALLRGFNHFYDLDNAVVLGYTPGYADNPDSSLIWMIRELMEQDDIKKSRFLPLDKPLSQGEVNDIEGSGKQLILFGAAFGLLDLADVSDVELPSDSIVMETGGMKTYRRSMDRSSMHGTLADEFGLDISRIHSEYGMCELLSQAYATGGRWFRSVPWMKVTIRDPENPETVLPPYEEGQIAVIDLANVHSCSFLLTGDRGIADPKGRFQVLGRWNPRDLRGCNFLIDED